MRGPAKLRDLVGEDNSSLPRIASVRADKTPDDTFLIWEGRKFSYADCWENMRRLGGLFATLGYRGNGDRIATYLPNCPEALWTWFAAALTGSVFVPLNRAHKGGLLADMIRRSRAKVLVTDARALADLPPAAEIGLERVIVTGTDTATGCIAFGEMENAPPADPLYPDPAEIGTLMYTSGTTGRSNAVRLPHNIYARNAARHAEALAYRPDDVFHIWFPQFHIWGSLTTAGLMIAGASIALFPSFSASRFWNQVEATGATWFGGLANVFHILLSQAPRATDRNNSLRAGHAAIVPPEMMRAFKQRFAVELYDEYGMTEAEPLSVPASNRPTPEESVGVASPDFEIIIADRQDQPVAAGIRGQVLARPRVPNVMMQGYEGDDAATVSALRNLWLHTGDVGRLDQDGFIYIHDRVKHMIRRRGENISALELEGLISEHPEVDQIACIGVASPLGDEDVKAVVVLNPGSSLQAADLHAYCVDRMAKFMVPRFIEITDALPFSEVGKVAKTALKTISDQTWDAEAAD